MENELHELSEKVKLLSAKYYSFFLARMFIKIVYQTTPDLMKESTWFKHTRVNERLGHYVLSCKSKGVYNFKLKPLYTTFLNSTKFSGYRTVAWYKL